MLQPARAVHIDPPPQAEVVLILAFLWPKVIEEKPLHRRLRRFAAAACNGRCGRPVFRSRSLPRLSRLGKRPLRSAGGASPALRRRISRGTCRVFRTFAAGPQGAGVNRNRHRTPRRGKRRAPPLPASQPPEEQLASHRPAYRFGGLLVA